MPSRRRPVVAAVAPVLLAAVLFVVVTPWVLRPWFLARDLLPRDAGAYAPMENADLYLNVWILAWIARAAANDPGALFDGNIFHPATNTIAGSENMLAHLPVTAPVMAATGSALAVLKAMALESFVLAGLFMFLFAWHHTRSVPASLVAGAAFTFAPWRVQSFPHPQYLGTQYLPLALLAVDLWVEGRRWRSLAGLAVAIALQILACLYLGYFTLFGVAAYAAARVWWSDPDGDADGGRRWHALLAVAVAMVLGGVLASPVAIPYLRARAAGIIPAFDVSRFQGHAWAPWDYLTVAFVGLGGLVVVLVALDVAARMVRAVPGRRGARDGRRGLASTAASSAVESQSAAGGVVPHPDLAAHVASPSRARECALWVMAATGVLLSTGPYLTLPGGIVIPTPYLLLYEIVPGFSAIRGPRRFFILVLAALSALAAHAFVRWAGRLPAAARGALGVALALGCAVAAAPHPSPVVAARLGDATPVVYRWLAVQPDAGAVLEVPGSAIDGDLVGNLRNAEYMLASTTHWRPLVNGFSGYEPPSYGFLTAAIRRLPAPDALAALVRGADVRWIVLHRDRLAGSEVARWAEVATPGLERVATFGTTEVYAVTLKSDGAWRATLRETPPPGRTLTGLLTAPLAPDCRAARIVEVAAPPVFALVPFPVPVVVRFANDGACPWPGVAVRPDGLVGLSYQWTSPSGETRPRGPFSRLLADVAPGATVEDTMVVIPPGAVVSDTAVDTDVVGETGKWRLDVFLEQYGVAEPLATASVLVQLNPMRDAEPRRPS